MIYLVGKSRRNEDGSFTIPADLAERWWRQLKTDYEALPENEKESDRKEADIMLEIVKREQIAEPDHNSGHEN
jgi:hypothetical protein